MYKRPVWRVGELVEGLTKDRGDGKEEKRGGGDDGDGKAGG